ncbi:MAG: hypothetical protein RLZZ367_340 [Bacteroidota bacterium]
MTTSLPAESPLRDSAGGGDQVIRTMKIQKTVAVIALIIIVVGASGCRKKDINTVNVQPVYYDIPFEITTKDSFYLADGLNSLGIKLVSIYDDRATGVLCSISSGGQANIKAAIYLNNLAIDTCLKSIPGCSNNQEYDTINPNAPKCVYQTYSIHLLKLNPYDKKEDDIAKYSVKYVIKRQ